MRKNSDYDIVVLKEENNSLNRPKIMLGKYHNNVDNKHELIYSVSHNKWCALNLETSKYEDLETEKEIK
jgi:hypothetical protein